MIAELSLPSLPTTSALGNAARCVGDIEGPLSLPQDILFHIVDNSCVHLLLRWRRTSRAFYSASAVALRRRYLECLSPFVDDLSMFDDVLRKHGAVISGSVALHFFLSCEVWRPRDLDIYVPDHTFDSFVAAAKSPTGLRFVSHTPPPQRSSSSAQPPFGLVKDIKHFRTPTNRSVDVIRSPSRSPLTPLHGFWSSLVKNFLTPDGAACAFPGSTMDRRGVVKLTPLNVRDRRAISKYKARGFTLTRDEWWMEAGDTYASVQRYFGDNHTLVIHFRTLVDDPVPTFPVVNTTSGWYMTQPYPPPTFDAYDKSQSFLQSSRGEDGSGW